MKEKKNKKTMACGLPRTGPTHLGRRLTREHAKSRYKRDITPPHISQVARSKRRLGLLFRMGRAFITGFGALCSTRGRDILVHLDFI